MPELEILIVPPLGREIVPVEPPRVRAALLEILMVPEDIVEVRMPLLVKVEPLTLRVMLLSEETVVLALIVVVAVVVVESGAPRKLKVALPD